MVIGENELQVIGDYVKRNLVGWMDEVRPGISRLSDSGVERILARMEIQDQRIAERFEAADRRFDDLIHQMDKRFDAVD